MMKAIYFVQLAYPSIHSNSNLWCAHMNFIVMLLYHNNWESYPLGLCELLHFLLQFEHIELTSWEPLQFRVKSKGPTSQQAQIAEVLEAQKLSWNLSLCCVYR